MNKLSFVALVVLLHTSPLAAQSQEKQAEAYDFKGDRLGMSIEEFTTNHPGQGVWVYCQNCKDKKAWNSTLSHENGKSVPTAFTLCSYTTTIADIPANVGALFVDGKLAAISVEFSAPSIQALTLVPQALTNKFGPPTGEKTVKVSRSGGEVLFWANSTSVAEFEERRCSSVVGSLSGWANDIAETLGGLSCDAITDTVTPESRVLFVSKPLGNLLQARIKEAANEAIDKAQSEAGQNGPYGFQDIHLDMSIAEFKTKHPAPKVEKYGPSASSLLGEAVCSVWTVGERKKGLENAAKGIVTCSYGGTYLSVSLRVSAMFVDSKLAVIEVEPPTDTSGCFESAPPTGTSAFGSYSAFCPPYQSLLRAWTDKLGPAVRIVSPNENLKDFDVRRWEDDSSVAEFQDHMCGPWENGGWSKMIFEVLGGTYCGRGDDLSARQPVMFYLHKELSRTFAMRLDDAAKKATDKAKSDF
jgi:hypothetical protein